MVVPGEDGQGGRCGEEGLRCGVQCAGCTFRLSRNLSLKSPKVACRSD